MKFDMGSDDLGRLTRQTEGSSDELGALVRRLVAAAEPLADTFTGTGRQAFDHLKQNTDEVVAELNTSLQAIIGGQSGMDRAFQQGESEMADNAGTAHGAAPFEGARFGGAAGAVQRGGLGVPAAGGIGAGGIGAGPVQRGGFGRTARTAHAGGERAPTDRPDTGSTPSTPQPGSGSKLPGPTDIPSLPGQNAAHRYPVDPKLFTRRMDQIVDRAATEVEQGADPMTVARQHRHELPQPPDPQDWKAETVTDQLESYISDLQDKYHPDARPSVLSGRQKAALIFLEALRVIFKGPA